MALYRLTAVPVAQRLGVTRPARSRPLLVGGDLWGIDLAGALHTAGRDVLMYRGTPHRGRTLLAEAIAFAAGMTVRLAARSWAP